MTGRRKFAGVIALAAVGAGIGWLVAFQRSGDSGGSAANPTTVVAPTPDAIAGGHDQGDAVAGPASPPTSSDPAGVTTASLEREYGDPTIARDAKLVIQRILDSALDQNRYEVHAIICHELNCQIFSNPKVSGAESDWPPIVESMTQELNKASFRNPETGAELTATLQSISRGRRKDAVTVTIIWLR